jgi:hypothetical protein
MHWCTREKTERGHERGREHETVCALKSVDDTNLSVLFDEQSVIEHELFDTFFKMRVQLHSRIVVGH